MKKFLKALVCAVLCIVMVFAVSACVTAPAGSSTGNGNGGANVNDGANDDILIPEGTKNAVVVRSVKGADNTVELTVSVEGTVEYAAVVGTLNYDSSVLEYVSHSAVDCANVNNKEAGVIAFAQANSKNYTTNQTLFKVTFKYTGTADTSVSFTFEEGNFTNDQLGDVQYTVFGNTVKLS